MIGHIAFRCLIYFSLVDIVFPAKPAQRFALPALGRGRRSRPARKMLRRVKLLGMCAESPASGARFVGQRFRFRVHNITQRSKPFCHFSKFSRSILVLIASSA